MTPGEGGSIADFQMGPGEATEDELVALAATLNAAPSRPPGPSPRRLVVLMISTAAALSVCLLLILLPFALLALLVDLLAG